MSPSTAFQGQACVELRDGAARALIAPDAGGRLLFWELGGRRIIHWPESPDWSAPAKIRGGNPLLFPFIARHFVDGAAGRWKDAAGTVHELPQHGFTRDGICRLREASSSQAVLELETRHPGYPFEFRFLTTCRLQGSALEVEFSTTNSGTVPLPYYAGHHFYFALPAAERPQWMLEMPGTRRRARQRPDGSIEDLAPGPVQAALHDPSLLDTFHLLDAAEPVRVVHPDGRCLEFDLPAREAPWHAVTTWTESPESPFYCIEPWLGLPNAIHHGRGLRWIAPGATERALCRIQAAGW